MVIVVLVACGVEAAQLVPVVGPVEVAVLYGLRPLIDRLGVLGQTHRSASSGGRSMTCI